MLVRNKQPFRAVELTGSLIIILINIAQIQAQTGPIPPTAPSEDSTSLYIMIAILTLGLAGAVYWWFNNKKAREEADRYSKTAINGNGSGADRNALDGNKELEWLRKNQQLVGKKAGQNASAKNTKPKQTPKNAPPINQALGRNEAEPNKVTVENSPSGEIEKTSPQLPIFSVNRVELARPFDLLPISDDEDLLSAIEQSYDEFEEDEEVRDLALRVMTVFRKRNSVEALSQIALYDLSSSLRSKAVNVLSEFDHESVFETILLCNADPTREVRAAAARALTKLTFDRADAWSRIAETGEEGRIAQTARAAIESGFVEMSFARLVSKDHKQAYEAFALMALLVKAGETAKIFNALETSRDMNVRRAILHTLKIIKDPKSLEELYLSVEKNNLPDELQEEVDRMTEDHALVTA